MSRISVLIISILISIVMLRCYNDSYVLESSNKPSFKNFAERAALDTHNIKKLFVFTGKESFDSVSSEVKLIRGCDTILAFVGVKIDYFPDVNSLSFVTYRIIPSDTVSCNYYSTEESVAKKVGCYILDPGTGKSYFDAKLVKKVDTVSLKPLQLKTTTYKEWSNYSKEFIGWCNNPNNKSIKTTYVKLRFVYNQDTAYKSVKITLRPRK